MNAETIRNSQVEELKTICQINGVDFNIMNKLLQSERVKKIRKRNHYIQQTIDSEIEKALDNEDK